MNQNISYKNEIYRKGIHLISLSIPIVYIFISKEFVLLLLIPVTLLFVSIDILSKKSKLINNFLMKYFGSLLRPHEIRGDLYLNGASWVLISALITVFIFPKIIAITAFTILIISDILAALIGRKYGKNKLFDKSWEGTIAFILSALIIVFIYFILLNLPKTYLIFGFFAAIIGGFIEAISKKINVDDDLSIPISIGLIMWIGDLISGNYYSLFEF